MNGENGDAFFKGVSIADGFVIFTLNDKESTEIKIPFYSETELTVHVTKPGTLKSLLTDEQMRTVLSLKVIGNINDDDIQTIDASMLVVEKVDLSDTDITGSGSFSGHGLLYGKQTLKEIIYPESCTDIAANTFYGCRNLRTVIAPGVRRIGSKAFYNCFNLTDLTISSLAKDNVSAIFNDSFSGCNPLNISIYDSSGVISRGTTGNPSYGSGKYRSIPMKTVPASTSAPEPVPEPALIKEEPPIQAHPIELTIAPDLHAKNRADYANREQREKEERIRMVMEYCHFYLPRIADQETVNHICAEVDKWMNLHTYTPKPIPNPLTKDINNIPLRHFVWNISERFMYKKYYNGDNRAGFIKALFPKAFADTDTSTIKNFKVEPLKTEIPIDEPENGKLDFHYPEDYVRN